MHSLAGLIRRMPPPTFSDTAITDRHSDTTIFQLRAGKIYLGLLDRKIRSDMYPRWESNSRLPACKASTLSTRPGSPLKLYLCVCVYSNSRNDVRRVAQRYGTIAAHTRRIASVLVVFVVFCVHTHSFAGLIRRTPPPTFSDTAITDRHSDTTIFQLRAHWVRISWSIGSEKSFGHVPPGGSRTLDLLHARRAPYPLFQALRSSCT